MPLHFPLGSERDQYESQAFHRMAIISGNIVVGVGRIHFDSEQSTRIRYMAVAKQFQRKGVGSSILEILIQYAFDHGAIMCWLKARQQACPFYQSQGFKVAGDTDSALPIQHFRMEKSLRYSSKLYDLPDCL